MNDYSIVTDPISFREAFFRQGAPSGVDEEYKGSLCVLLYFVWRGAFHSRSSLVLGRVQQDLGYLCLSAYIALLPFLQMTRMGYPADALVLLRALMERVALIGYFNAYPSEIGKYVTGQGHLQKKAMAWAKREPLENWMPLYGLLSNVAHSKMVGPAGHVLAENEIGTAFRQNLSLDPEKGADFTEILIVGALYVIAALDPFTSRVLGESKFESFSADPDVLHYVDSKDLEEFFSFAQGVVDKYLPGESNLYSA